eukprot:COSAG02_NODE_12212_length_1580_cov_1.159352_2_plen_113_part_01
MDYFPLSQPALLAGCGACGDPYKPANASTRLMHIRLPRTQRAHEPASSMNTTRRAKWTIEAVAPSVTIVVVPAASAQAAPPDCTERHLSHVAPGGRLPCSLTRVSRQNLLATA